VAADIITRIVTQDCSQPGGDRDFVPSATRCSSGEVITVAVEGSTIALVNAANVDAGPVTTYTYDPSGNPTLSGRANSWPFQYQGMEK
jgi:hypothetical protein